MKKIQDILKEIEIVRNQMNKLIESNADLTSKDIIDLSQKLDKLLNKYNKMDISD